MLMSPNNPPAPPVDRVTAELTVKHAESIEYVLGMLDTIAPRTGGADNRALAREAVQIIRRAVDWPSSQPTDEQVERAARVLVSHMCESTWEELAALGITGNHWLPLAHRALTAAFCPPSVDHPREAEGCGETT
jgi:hypothetical protein